MSFKWITRQAEAEPIRRGRRRPRGEPCGACRCPMNQALARWLDSDVGYSFRTSPMAIGAAAIALICIFCARLRRLGRAAQPVRPGDARARRRAAAAGLDGRGRSRKYLLGTDDQGRDILSALMYGARISLFVGVASVLLSMLIGVALGLLVGLRRRLDRRASSCACAT